MLSSTVVFVLIFASSCHGYNVDISSPLIVYSGLSSEQQANYSFGFSMAYHTYTNGDKALLVGAPNAEHTGGLTEGGVYVCPLVHNEMCTRNEAFNFRNDTYVDIDFGDPTIQQADEYFDGQLLGYSVTSKKDKVMACAPMYIGESTSLDTREFYFLRGRCVLLPQDFNSTSTPTQLYDGSFTTAGIGAHIFDRDPSDDDLFYAIGSVRSGQSVPVPGQVFMMDTVTNSDGTRGRKVASSERPSVQNAWLQGYHIEEGYIFQNSLRNIIASGPKANRHKGHILVYGISVSTLTISLTINGPPSVIDGYFGYDFATVNLLSNGFDSLVVSCPLCDGDRGVVYVYVHTGNSGNPFNVSDVQIISSPRGGQFGTSVENIGDIDQDGYDDVAISAPYERRGVVYVYRGSPNGLLVDEYQVIPAPEETIGFGNILTGGLDVDSNSYPDFTVGDFVNRAVYTFRSSPVIDVSISTKEENLTLDYTIRNCELQGIASICFIVTPCFNFSTLYGGIDRFAVKYTLVVDEFEQRVGLLDNILTNRVTNETTIYSNEERSCGTPHKFVLVPDFSKLDPIPLRITITNSDSPLPLSTPNSEMFGGDLHPILTSTADGSEFNQNILPNYVQNCGPDGICNPVFLIQVTPNIPTSDGLVPLASGFSFSLDVTLQNTQEDGLASNIIIDTPNGIRLSNSESTTEFAISTCESQGVQEVRCSLKNPILVDEIVRFRVHFRPDVLSVDFSATDLNFNFTIQNPEVRGSTSISLGAKSVASYNVQGSFGVDEEQARRFVPSANQSSLSLSAQGPSVNYQVTVRHTGYNDEDSPIPSLIIDMIWPTIITLEGGTMQPLLVLTDIVPIGSESVTCRLYNVIPNHLLSPAQQSSYTGPPLNASTSSVKRKHCPENVTCGVIQCEIRNLAPQNRDTPTPPVQISIFSTLWSASVREVLNISVYAETRSDTAFPIISESLVDSLVTIKFQPAVTETDRACFQLWIIGVSVLGGLVLAFLITLGLGLCGCFGRGYYKKKKEEALRNKEQQRQLQFTDGSNLLGARIIPPPSAGYSESLAAQNKEKEHEAELEMENNAYVSDPGKLPETFSPFKSIATASNNTNEGEITDELVQRELLGEGGNNLLGGTAENNNDLETEI